MMRVYTLPKTCAMLSALGSSPSAKHRSMYKDSEWGKWLEGHKQNTHIQITINTMNNSTIHFLDEDEELAIEYRLKWQN